MTKLTANQMAQYTNKLIIGENTKIVSTWPSNYIDGIVTDPPYGIGFMGKEWDTFKQENVNRPKTTKLVYKTDYIGGVSIKRKNPEIVTRDSGARRAGSYDLSRNPEFQQWFTIWAKAILRITKPGGFLLCFGGTRTHHRVTCAIEDAGWEIRDCMMWLYGSGFPKSHNISKAIDKAAGAKRKVIGTQSVPGYARSEVEHGKQNRNKYEFEQTSNEAATPLAEVWDGYGTALKPAWEPIIVAMKPLDGTFAHNAEKHSVAGLNIDGGRIPANQGEYDIRHYTKESCFMNPEPKKSKFQIKPQPSGRWPANIILDEASAELLGEPARFFYCAKTSKKERNLGCEELEKVVSKTMSERKPDNSGQNHNTTGQKPAMRQNNHPTVKPLALMKYLCTLLKMPNPNQIILDPFIGSGTTGMACKSLGINYIGIDKESDYCHIARKRIDATRKEPK